MISSIQDAHTLTQAADVCLSCPMRQRCFTATLDDDDTVRVGRLVERRRTLPRGHWLYQSGSLVRGRVYALRRGDVKIVQDGANGSRFIDRFQHEGEIIGLDTIGQVHHINHAVTLGTVELCELPFAALQRMASTHAALRSTMFGLVQHQLRQQHAITLRLKSNNAQQRLVGALLALARTQAQPGMVALQLRLAMSRQDLADHLGMGRATISRLLSQMQAQGLLQVAGRLLTIPQPAALASSCGLAHVDRPAGLPW